LHNSASDTIGEPSGMSYLLNRLQPSDGLFQTLLTLVLNWTNYLQESI